LGSKKAITKVHAIIMVAIIVVAVIGVGYYYWPRPQPPVKPIKIGMLLDLTGALALYGYSNEKTISAAVRKINAEGGVAGRPVEIYVEDTETKVATAVMRMRKLIEYWGVDFILGPNHSGIGVACAPIAKELKTVFWVNAAATEITAEKGNRYVFRMCSNVRQEVIAMAEWAVKNLGKKWATLVADYAWGWSYEEEFKKIVPEYGGTVLKSIRAPLGTKDFMPYIPLIPAEVEAVLIAFFGADLLALIRDLYTVRPDLGRIVACYGLTGIATEPLGAMAEGLYIIGTFPRRLEEFDTPNTRVFRELIGLDPDGHEVGNPDLVYAHAYNWAIWEAMFALKRAIEVSGWKSKEDNPALIKALEGMKLKESIEFPQGDKFIRAEDHQAFMRIFIEKVVNGKLKVVETIPAEKTVYPPPVDYTKEPF